MSLASAWTMGSYFDGLRCFCLESGVGATFSGIREEVLPASAIALLACRTLPMTRRTLKFRSYWSIIEDRPASTRIVCGDVKFLLRVSMTCEQSARSDCASRYEL